jgi:hypothetical protein
MLKVGKARFDYTCIDCGVDIPKGTRYVSDVSYSTASRSGQSRYVAKNKRCLACAIKDPTTPAETAGVMKEILRMIKEQS